MGVINRQDMTAAEPPQPANQSSDSTTGSDEDAQPSGITIARFDSTKLETGLRYDAWRENMGVLFDVASSDGSSPDLSKPASIVTADLGDTVLARARAESQLFRRSARRLHREELGLILVQYFPRGGGIICGRERLVAGDMQIIDTEKPYELAATDYENLTLMVPHDLRATLSPVIDKLHARSISGKNPMVRMLGDHLQSLWRNVSGMDISQARIAVQGTIGLLHGYLATDSALAEELEPAVGDALGLAMRRFIEQNLEKSLKPEQLAREFRVSRSQVYRLFKRDDGVARYVWERRLQRSRVLLTTPWLQHLDIGAVAFEVGYSSNAHFTRAFRARFGMTPSRMRAEARDGSSSQPAERTAGQTGHSIRVPEMVRRVATSPNTRPAKRSGTLSQNRPAKP